MKALRRIEALALATLVAIPLVRYLVYVAKTGVERFALHGDFAGLELATRFVWTGRTLLGPYSRFTFNHPGPLYFYALAPVYALAGSTSTGIFAGACAINVAAAAITVYAARTLSTRSHAVAVALVLLAWSAAFGDIAAIPWNPLVIVLPLIAFLVFAAFFAQGASIAAPFSFFFGAFAGESHVSTVPTVVGCSAVSIVAFALVKRRAGGVTRVERRHLAIGVAVVVLAALPPLVEQFVAKGGNLTKLVRFFIERPGSPMPYRDAVAHWTVATGWLPERLFSATITHEPGDPAVMGSFAIDAPSSAAKALAVAWLAAVTAATGIAARRRDRVSLALLTSGLLSSALGLLSFRGIVGPTANYLVFWTTAGTTVGWMGVATTLADVVSARLGVARAARLTPSLVVAALVVACAWTTSLQGAWLAKDVLIPRPDPARREVYEALLARLRATGETPVVHREAAWDEGLSILLELTKDGIDVRVPERDRWLEGRQLLQPEGAPRPLHVYTATALAHLDTEPCLELLARSGSEAIFVSSSDLTACPTPAP